MALGWRGQYYRYKDFFLNVMSLYKKRSDLRMFLEIILSLTTVIIFLSFALKPTAITIINLIKEIDQKKKTVVTLDTKLDNLERAGALIDGGEVPLQTIESAVPTLPEPDGFAAQVQGIANKNSVRLLGLSFGEITLVGKEEQKKKTGSDTKPLPADAKEMPVSISITGSYDSLILFLNDMETIRRPIKIDSFTINASQTELGQNISVIISGRVPFLGS